MAKVPVLTMNKTEITAALVPQEDALYQASDSQRVCRSMLWAAWKENPTERMEDMTAAKAMQLTGEPRLHKWWGQAGFTQWLLMTDQYAHRVRAMAERAQEVLFEALHDPLVKPDLKIRVALEIQRQFLQTITAVKEAPKFLDEGIQNASPAELKEIVQRLERNK